MPNFTLQVGSQTYVRKTKTAATQAALDHLAALFPDDYRDTWSPIVVQIGATILVGFKTDSGSWGYHIHRDGSGAGSASGDWTRRQCEIRMRRHAAQYAYTGPDADPAVSLAYIHRDDAEGYADHQRWIRFQVEYAAARAAGLSDNDAHTKACGH